MLCFLGFENLFAIYIYKCRKHDSHGNKSNLLYIYIYIYINENRKVQGERKNISETKYETNTEKTKLHM